jgi:septal ring factor EnvC (AmiA/AmiB activator)
MTRRTLSLLGGLVLAPVLVLGMACSSDDDPATDDGVALEDREEYEAEVESRLNAIDQEIDTLEGRIQEQGGDVQDDLDEELDSLKDDREELEEKLDDLRNASDENWGEVRDDIEDSLDDLDGRIDEF